MSNLPTLNQSLVQAIEKSQAKRSAGGDSNAQFMKMCKDGTWVYGAEDTEVEPGSLWAVNPESLSEGFIAWSQDGQPMGEEMASIFAPDIIKADLPDVGAPWMPQFGFQLLCLEGEDAGTMCLYKANSKGGHRMFAKLQDTLVGRARAGEVDLVPVVSLETDSYKHKNKSYGKIYTPVMDITRWENLAAQPKAKEVESEVEPEPEPEPEPARKRRSRKAA